MQDRRFRPGDVLDDYCPRERRITDHAIVAMIDDEIRQTRCGSCEAEHEYKAAKVPAARRKTQPPALFTQVLDGLQGPAAQAQPPEPKGVAPDPDARPIAASAVPVLPPDPVPAVLANEGPTADADPPLRDDGDDGPRRSLIRAQFPKVEGQAAVPRALPEFTVQSLLNRRNNAGQRNAGGQGKFRRRRPGGGGLEQNVGPMRFRDHGQGDGRPGGQGQGNGNGQGPGGGGGRRRRGGKKNH